MLLSVVFGNHSWRCGLGNLELAASIWNVDDSAVSTVFPNDDGACKNWRNTSYSKCF